MISCVSNDVHFYNLGFHSAKTRIDTIQSEFPELSYMNESVLKEVNDEVKMYQLSARQILLDLQHSYQLCWITQMTRRCAQMLLKYESVAIVQLYETGMLEEHEYSHVLQLIEEKLFSLEYGSIKMPDNQMKRNENPFDLLSYFGSLSPNEKSYWQSVLTSKHKWFQPGSILVENRIEVSTAYLIVRGIVQSQNDEISFITYYRCGSIVGVDALFAGNSLSRGSYTAEGGLVEAYLIDSTLLSSLLADEKIARSIYDEILLQTIMNCYRKSVKLTYSQLKVFLNEKATLHNNKTNLVINLETNQRLFLLSGTMSRFSDDSATNIDSPQFILLGCPEKYQFNAFSIVYTWLYDDEVNFDTDKNQLNVDHEFYPIYSESTGDFFPRRKSSSIVRPMESRNNRGLLTLEINAKSEETDSVKFHP